MFEDRYWPNLSSLAADALGHEPVAAFFKSCQSIAALPGAQYDDRFPRLSSSIAMPANDR